MKFIYRFLPWVFFIACNPAASRQDGQPASEIPDTSASVPQATGATIGEEEESEYTTCYILIVDTGPGYYSLRDKMTVVSASLNIPIDTLGRHYDLEKNLIALDNDDEDEMYAGAYFPRRFPSVSLSLEYLDFYNRQAGEKTLALVAGIYELNPEADSALSHILNFEKKAFVLRSEIFTGCMH